MAAAWRGQDDPLLHYLLDGNEGASEELKNDSGIHRTGRSHVMGRGDERCPDAVAKDLQWWAAVCGQLSRVGVHIRQHLAPLDVPDLCPPVHGLLEEFVSAIISHQLTLRSAVRLLHGSLALVCGRGVSVPLPPLPALVAHAGGPGLLDPLLRSCYPSLRQLRHILIRSISTVAAELRLTSAEARHEHTNHECSFIRSCCLAIEAVAAECYSHGGSLLHIQDAMRLAADQWAAFFACVASASHESDDRADGDTLAVRLERIIYILKCEVAFLSEAFSFAPAQTQAACAAASATKEAAAGASQETTAQDCAEVHEGLSAEAQRRGLQSLAHDLAHSRARLDSAVAAVFLAQCAAADAIRAVEAGTTEGVPGKLGVVTELVDKANGYLQRDREDTAGVVDDTLLRSVCSMCRPRGFKAAPATTADSDHAPEDGDVVLSDNAGPGACATEVRGSVSDVLVDQGDAGEWVSEGDARPAVAMAHVEDVGEAFVEEYEARGDPDAVCEAGGEWEGGSCVGRRKKQVELMGELQQRLKGRARAATQRRTIPQSSSFEACQPSSSPTGSAEESDWVVAEGRRTMEQGVESSCSASRDADACRDESQRRHHWLADDILKVLRIGGRREKEWVFDNIDPS